MFNNQNYYARSAISGRTGALKSLISPASNGQDVIGFSQSTVSSINNVLSDYTQPLADKQYNSIDSDRSRYLKLLTSLAQLTVKNPILKSMMDITIDGLIASQDLKNLYERNLDLMMQITDLEKQIDTILSGKNEIKTMSGATGQFGLSKTFVLAPVYSVYINLYGMPAYGVGFDPFKLNTIANILESKGIQPFGKKTAAKTTT